MSESSGGVPEFNSGGSITAGEDETRTASIYNSKRCHLVCIQWHIWLFIQSAAIFVGSIWVLFQHKPSFNRKPKSPSLYRQISPLSPHLRLLQSRMSGSERIYEAWMEETIPNENGRRVINYYLSYATATATGSRNSLLAVVGTERGNRHYEYVVSKSFLEEFGSSPAINANTKWTSRKPVIEWLKSLVRKDDPPPTNSSLQEYNEGDNVMLRHRTERLLTPHVSAQPTTDVPVDVLDERFMPTRRGGFRQYLVHWSNRSDDERSWISATEFRRLAPDLFEHYTRFSSTEPNFS